ncbi:dehydrogenase/reductase [Alcanivorax sp. MD8A]|uniref:Pteridine reductase n=2 Tax=Alcanivoracaceae TaxID=224372 RepID=A0A418XW92_9GAMM|nr:pteridine reductase [Alcanivorax sp. P2S70]PNE03009.1 dehydrogenase/reductase [Alcanivorax sp. MD8A]RJG17086.1 pteridine reductase [Alcanivorax profundi]
MDPVALITGSARRIGAEITRTLHQQGMRVIIHYRNSDTQANTLANQLNSIRPDSARVLQADLDKPDEVRRLGGDALAAFGQVNLLVNNASSFYPTPLEEATDADWDALMHSNLRAPYLLCQALSPSLRKHRGAIINIVDVYAEKPLEKHTLYCMAKAGLAMMTRSLARELGPDIRVNGVSPGPILWPEAGQMNQEAITASTALKRCGEPADIAGAVAWLARDAGFVTGQILAVDGGRSLAFQGG